MGSTKHAGLTAVGVILLLLSGFVGYGCRGEDLSARIDKLEQSEQQLRASIEQIDEKGRGLISYLTDSTDKKVTEPPNFRTWVLRINRNLHDVYEQALAHKWDLPEPDRHLAPPPPPPW